VCVRCRKLSRHRNNTLRYRRSRVDLRTGIFLGCENLVLQSLTLTAMFLGGAVNELAQLPCRPAQIVHVATGIAHNVHSVERVTYVRRLCYPQFLTYLARYAHSVHGLHMLCR
jgi:hypothetical protein